MKEEKDTLTAIYGFCLVDGYKEKVANCRVEPPSLFRGRGKHPKTGHLKPRIRPEDVVLNIGVDVPIPKPPEGHKWKGIVHNNQVTWLAYYCSEDLTKKNQKRRKLIQNIFILLDRHALKEKMI